ncbi:hypothetical protein [Actinomycetospora aeridis]|uniref:Uncharacterized protein n=1 Tax=Actinomycetospora aeridis TaxID=3129231 RepID=A0ABU8N7F8_9PSEU
MVNAPGKWGWTHAVFALCVVVEAILLYELVVAPGAPAELIVAVTAVLVVALVVPRLADLVSIKLPGGVEAQLKEVTSELERTNDRLDSLFAISMSPWQCENLEKLASGHFGDYVMSGGLDNDLRHLRSHGYVHVEGIRAIPQRGENLSEFVEITEAGRRFVALRASVDPGAPVSGSS